MICPVRPAFAQTSQAGWVFCVGTTSTFEATPSIASGPVFDYQLMDETGQILLDLMNQSAHIDIKWDYPAGQYQLGVREMYDSSIDPSLVSTCSGDWVWQTVTLQAPTPIRLDPTNIYRLCGVNSHVGISYNSSDYQSYLLSSESVWKPIDGQPLAITEAGDYELTVEDQYGCQAKTNFTIAPSIRAVLGQDTIVCTPEFRLHLLQTEGNPTQTVYSWYTATVGRSGSLLKSGSDTELTVNDHDITTDVIYWVDAELDDCRVSDTTVVMACDIPLLDIPNVITPNGDGENDVWNIKGLEQYPGSTLEVFDRWGRRVFFTRGNSQKWDGRDMNGKALPVEAYYYILKLNTERQKYPITGVIHIIK